MLYIDYHIGVKKGCGQNPGPQIGQLENNVHIQETHEGRRTIHSVWLQ